MPGRRAEEWANVEPGDLLALIVDERDGDEGLLVGILCAGDNIFHFHNGRDFELRDFSTVDRKTLH